MSDSIVVGFGFRARNGKDSAVKAIIEAFKDQYDVRRYAFADQLKAEVYDALQAPLDPYWGTTSSLDTVPYLLLPHPRLDGPELSVADKVFWVDEHKSIGLARHLQIYGSEYRRAQDSFYWVKKLRARIEQEQPQFALISDMRFKNEYYFVKAFGGYTVKVSRHGFTLNDGRGATHVSETDLNDMVFDFEINVLDGELPQLKRDARTVFEMILDSLRPSVPASLEVKDFEVPAETAEV